jgi:hypothetical protein
MRKLIIIFLLISSSTEAQKIASIEKINNCFDEKYKDTEVLRELFYFENNEWKTIKTSAKSVSYYFPFQNFKIFVKFKKKIKNPNNNACLEGLFKLPKKYTLEKQLMTRAPLSIKYEEILEYRILTNTIKTKQAQKDTIGFFNEKQKSIVTAKFNEKIKSFGLAIPNPICPPIQEIDSSYLLTTNSLILGSLEIMRGQCYHFSVPGDAYGGGTIYFILYPNNEVKFLFGNTQLLEVADYNGNGKNEYLFYISNLNTTGYLLFYDNFEKYTESTFAYH